MHIVTASDDNYVAGAVVLIASAHRHNPQARFTYLANDLSPESMLRVRTLAQRLGCRVDLVDIADSRLQSLEVRRAHLTRATFARLFIPELLDEDGRVIYMDCDMLVTGPLDEIWEAPLGPEHLLGAVPCPSPTTTTIARLGISKSDYFNGGLQVFDLDTWRRNRVAETCRERLTSPDHTHLTGDEATMNDVARGRYYKLPSG